MRQRREKFNLPDKTENGINDRNGIKCQIRPKTHNFVRNEVFNSNFYNRIIISSDIISHTTTVIAVDFQRIVLRPRGKVSFEIRKNIEPRVFRPMSRRIKINFSFELIFLDNCLTR